jgi:CRP-like cAMP-binding protein
LSSVRKRLNVDVAVGLSRSYLFEGIATTELEPLASSATIIDLVRGERVFGIGDQADELYVVLSGEVKDSVVDGDGYEVVHFVHGPGMTFGEPGFFAVDRTRIVEVFAVNATTLIRLDREHLVPFIDRHGTIKDRALEGLASATRWQSTLIAALATRPLTDRLVLRLVELVDSARQRAGEPAATPKISQSTLAAMIGVSRENVNRALSALALDGLIRLDRGRYVLVDEERLRRRASRDWPIALRRDRRLDSSH